MSGAEFAALGAAWTKPVAVAFGIAYVVLAIRQHRACWLAGVISTALYATVFYRAGLFMQAVLQLYYVAIAVYGWHAWRALPGRDALPVSRAPWRLQLAGLVAVLLATAASSLLLARSRAATEPLLDSLTSWASVFATWLQARKQLDNWAWWLVIDLLCALLFWQTHDYPTMLLYLFYLVLIAIGWRSWGRDYARRRQVVAA